MTVEMHRRLHDWFGELCTIGTLGGALCKVECETSLVHGPSSDPQRVVEQVEVACVARRLFDHVHQDPAGVHWAAAERGNVRGLIERGAPGERCPAALTRRRLQSKDFLNGVGEELRTGLPGRVYPGVWSWPGS